MTNRVGQETGRNQEKEITRPAVLVDADESTFAKEFVEAEAKVMSRQVTESSVPADLVETEKIDRVKYASVIERV